MTLSHAASRRRFTHLLLRILLLLAGMFLASLGIALTTLAGLGTTPISTVPYTGAAITGLTFGTCVVILNFAYVAGQIALLRRRYSPMNLLQIPIGFLFGAFIDLSMFLLSSLTPNGWWTGALMSVIGNVILALGTVMQIRSKTLVQPGEGFVIAAAALARKSFGTMKIVNDLALTGIAATMGLVFLGEIHAIREGTLASAILIGLFAKLIDHGLNRLFPKEAAPQEEPREVPLKRK